MGVKCFKCTVFGPDIGGKLLVLTKATNVNGGLVTDEIQPVVLNRFVLLNKLIFCLRRSTVIEFFSNYFTL